MKTKRIIVTMLVLSIVMSVLAVLPVGAVTGIKITSPTPDSTINNSNYSILFKWTCDLGAYKYLITLQNTTTGDYNYKSSSFTTKSFTVPDSVLSAGKYKFKVVAVDYSGNVLDSEYIKFNVTR